MYSWWVGKVFYFRKKRYYGKKFVIFNWLESILLWVFNYNGENKFI